MATVSIRLLLLLLPIHQYHMSFLITGQAGICQICLLCTMQPVATQGPDQCVSMCKRLVTIPEVSQGYSAMYNFVSLHTIAPVVYIVL